MIKTLILIALILVPQLSCACSGIRFTEKWIEPITNSDGTPLTDLAKTTLYYQVNTSTPVKKDYPAKLLTGGATKTVSFTPIMNCKTQTNTVKKWVTATDTKGYESTIYDLGTVTIPIIK